MNSTLYIVIPCYKEQEVLHETASRLKVKMESLIAAGKISSESRVMFVNDGSSDNTWPIICELHESDPLFSGINLSRNRGHQNALLAGLMTAKDLADMVISMDADLQDDIDAVDAMVDKYHEGCDIVYGVRSEGFYRVMSFLGADTVFNHADYRLMSKRALEGLAQFKEVNLFLRGIVPMIGYKSDVVTYERGERFAGESKYPLKKMLAFAMEGITSLSTKPIRFIATLGFAVFHQHGCDHFCNQHSHADLLYRSMGDRRYRSWMGQRDLLCLGNRRSGPAVHWCNRRVHRQDLPGNQGAPALYHSGCSG